MKDIFNGNGWRPWIVALGLICAWPMLRAETPVMSMVPRWDEGYGWQVFYKWREANDWMNATETAPPQDRLLRRETHLVELGAVYTWDRSIRLVGTLPYFYRNEDRREGGTTRSRSDRGFGDLKLALPLRKYFNGRGYSGNLSLNPRVELPTGDDNGTIGFSHGSTSWGMGLSGERETTQTIISGGVTYWWDRASDQGNRIEADAKIGFQPNAAMQITLEFDWDQRLDGGGAGHTRLRMGPAWFWWIDKTVLFKVGYNHVVHESRESSGLGGENEFRIGVGMVY